MKHPAIGLKLLSILFALSMPVLSFGQDGPGSDGGGVVGTLVNEITGERITGPLGSIKNQWIEVLQESSPEYQAAVARLREIDQYIPAFSRTVLGTEGGKPIIIDPKALNPICRNEADEYFSNYQNRRLVACQNATEIRISMRWWNENRNNLPHKRDIIIHEKFISMFLYRRSLGQEVTYDRVIELDALVATPALWSESLLNSQISEVYGPFGLGVRSQLEPAAAPLNQLYQEICARRSQVSELVPILQQHSELMQSALSHRSSRRERLIGEARALRAQMNSVFMPMLYMRAEWHGLNENPSLLARYRHACRAATRMQGEGQQNCATKLEVLVGNDAAALDRPMGSDGWEGFYIQRLSDFVQRLENFCSE